MAHQWSRANLLAASFPFLTDLWGQTVMQSQGDIGNTNFGPDSINKPQLFYAENVMPTTVGYQSISFKPISVPNIGTIPSRYIQQVFELQVPNPIVALGFPAFITIYVATTVGNSTNMWVLNQNVSENWAFVVTPYVSTIIPMQITTAFSNGQTYLFMAGQGAFHYNAGAGTFVADAFIGVTAANLLGITATNGYIIAYSNNGTFWNSNTNPLDFTPSLVTGAGGGPVQEVKSQIVGCFGISGGFIIYTFNNAVQAAYTGNVNFPFKFSEVAGSGGIDNQSKVSWQDDSSTHFIYGSKGLQVIEIGSDATPAFPEVTEMLTAGYVETFNIATLTFSRSVGQGSDFSTPLITLCGTRYVVISYNPTQITVAASTYINYSHALVYDLLLKRWGKIVHDHTDCIGYENILQVAYVDTSPRGVIGFVGFLGDLVLVDMDFTYPGNEQGGGNSVVLFGKFQIQRNKGIYLQRAAFENLDAGQNWDAYAIATLDGRTKQPAVKLVDISTALGNGNDIRTFGGDNLYGLNISILLIGNFNLTSFEIDMTVGGSY